MKGELVFNQFSNQAEEQSNPPFPQPKYTTYLTFIMHKRPKGFSSSPYYNMSPEDISENTLKKWYKKAFSGDIEYQIRITNYFRNAWNKNSYMKGSEMIHEKDYVPMDCYICGAHMPSIHDTHNPQPLAPSTTPKQALDNNLPYRCCTQCNQKVYRERIRNSKALTFKHLIVDFFTDYPLLKELDGVDGVKVGKPVWVKNKEVEN